MPASRALRPRQPGAVMDIAAQSRDLAAGRVAGGSIEMTTLLVTHPACAGHDMGEGHPERPARLRAVDQALESEKFQMLARDSAPRAPIEAVTRVHPAAYVAAIEQASPTQGRVRVDQDTSMSPGTWEAAIRAAGGAVFAVDEIVAARAVNAFVAMRPPGHHAETSTPMGFCFFNNAAIAARHAQAVHGLARVAIVDWDVHHGNGTQDIFWNDSHVLYMSAHQYPYYPGSGAPTELGGPDAKGTTINVGLPAASNDAHYAAVFDHVFLPALAAFAPDLVLISAGFDAFEHDPLAGMRVTQAGFGAMARRLRHAAEQHAGGR